MEKKIYDYSLDKDAEAEKQFKSCYSEPFVIAAALMPDAHSGYAAPIGSVLVTKEFIVPAWVGYDIGCGLIAVKLSSLNKKITLIPLIEKNSKEIYHEVTRKIPMGMGEINKSTETVSEENQKEFFS